MVLALLLPSAARAGELADEDRAQLEAAFERAGLFDPRGARRVRAAVFIVEGGVMLREGWAPPGDGAPRWLALDDLSRARLAPDAVPAEGDDFLAGLRALLPAPGVDEQPRWVELHLGPPAILIGLAAWALRLGDEALAADLLMRGRGALRLPRGADVVPPLRRHLAEQARTTLVRALAERADAAALEAARTLAGYPEQLAELGDAAALVRDVERRAAAATARDDPGLERRPLAGRVALLVASLEDVETRDDLATEPRVAALIGLGDAAVPALIECLDRDERFTRALDPEAGAPSLLPVRAAALAALEALLRVVHFGAPPEKAAPLVRAYWSASAGLPLEERLRRALVDPATTLPNRRAAADAATEHDLRERALALGGPTIAEALLQALDLELAPSRAGARRGAPDQELERVFCDAVGRLEDARVLPALRRRLAAATSPALLVHLARACEALGDPDPLDHVATRFAAGALWRDLRAPRHDELPEALRALLAALVDSERPARAAALEALLDPRHPLYRVVLDRVLRRGWDCHVLTERHVGLRLLLAALGDETPLRAYALGEDDTLTWQEEGSTTYTGLPGGIDAADCVRAAQGRVCDEAAARLAQLVVGLPPYHALLRDRDARLPRLRRLAAAFVPGARKPDETLLPVVLTTERFLPRLLPLDRAATAEDVEHGRAVFHLDGRGVRADVRLPALALVRRETDQVTALVVQAETGPDGRRVFGVIMAGDLAQVPAADLSGFMPFPTDAELDAEADALADVLVRGDAGALAPYLEGWTLMEREERLAELRQDLGADRARLRSWARIVLRPRPGGWTIDP